MPIWTKLIKSCAISALLAYLAGDLTPSRYMKRHILALRFTSVALLLTLFQAIGSCRDRNQEDINREIFARTLEMSSDAADAPMGELVVRIAESFMGTPYVGGTLEVEPEELQICMDKTDCILFVEMCTCLALTFKGIDLAIVAGNAEEDGTHTPVKAGEAHCCSTHDDMAKKGTTHTAGSEAAPSYELFCRNVQAMRYRKGIVDGYASRLHYTSEWILQAERLGIMEEFSSEIGQEYTQSFSFMSGHPDSYRQMRDPATREAIAAAEKDIEAHAPFYYVSQERLRDASVVSSIRDGDIIFLMSRAKGLDIAHVAIAREVNGEMHFIHASSKAGEVILEPRTLADYAANGIRVARLK